MANLLKRFKHAVEADLHTMFDKKEQKNPLSMLNQYIREAEKQTEQTGKWLERQVQLKKQLENELAEAMKMKQKREVQLGLALQNEEADLVSFVEQEVHAYSNRENLLRDSLTKTTEELIGLERKYEEMKHKVKDMKVRQLQLMGKENVVRAHHQMNNILNPEANAKVEKRLNTFEEMEEYIDRLGQRIDHQHEVTSMERRLEALEKKEEKQQEIV